MKLYDYKVEYSQPDKEKLTEYYSKYKEFKKMQAVIGRKDKQLYDKVGRCIKDFRLKFHQANKAYRIVYLNRIDLNNDYRQVQKLEYIDDLNEIVRSMRNKLVSHIKSRRLGSKEKRIKTKATSWGDTVELVGRAHEKEGTILNLISRKKVQEVFKPKGPQSEENHVGVEIEFASFLHHDDIALILHEAGLTPYIQLQHEYVQGRHSGEFEYELTVVAKETEIKSVIEKICEILNERVDANITFGCGLHVHIDARNRNIDKVFNNLYNSQKLLYAMVAYSRRENRFCKPMEKKMWNPTKKDGADCGCGTPTCRHVPDAKEPDRYFGLNTWSYMKHKTFEVRIHSGTASAIKINNWIDLLLSIVDGPAIPKNVNDLSELEKFVSLDVKLKDYVVKRIKTFAEKHNKDYEVERDALRVRTRTH